MGRIGRIIINNTVEVLIFLAILIVIMNYLSNRQLNFNFIELFVRWVVLAGIIFAIREFLLNSEEVVSAHELKYKYPSHISTFAKFDKEGNAKVPCRLLYKK